MLSRLKKVTRLLFYFSFIITLQAQNQELSSKDYGFQINDVTIPKTAPDGYESIKTVQLNTPLYADKAYAVSFWIFGPQLKDRGYSFPLNVFPSNFMGSVDDTIFNLVESDDIMPALEVNPPPSYTTQGHFTFEIRPDTLYNFVTVALKVDRSQQLPINIPEDVTVTGVFVKLLPDRIDEKAAKEILREAKSVETVPKVWKLAERVLIDSKKSYTIAEKEISIGLYDHRNIDKDRVTIYLNDEIIVKNLELKRKKQFFKMQLRPGMNTITLHAENLGEVAPNTAAIVVKNASKEFMAVLESDLGASQFFTLVYEPK